MFATASHLSKSDSSMLGTGVEHRGKKYVIHSTLPHHHSALVTFTFQQKTAILIGFGLLLACLLLAPQITIVIFMAILNVVYMANLAFDASLVWRSAKRPPELNFDDDLKSLKDADLPIYTILCPLYHEAAVLPHFVQSIAKLDYPKEKLEVMLLLEDSDEQTHQMAEQLKLPSYFKVVTVPHSNPKTKPKACNYGLGHARGKYLVVFDAEDQPEPDQLKKVVLAFKKVPAEVVCLQAKLNYYNPGHNLLTRLFTAEYSLWFDLILPGLQSMNTLIPLGGTSNHFQTDKLRELHGWDAFNVTEDCDLGIRLFRHGYRTAIINSTTLEEANSNFLNWLRQRSRWIKGYMQTYLVQMRDPGKLIKQHKWHALVFQLNVGGKVATMIINPFLWLTTIAYFSLRSVVGPAIESVYPAPVFYVGIVSLLAGNFMYLYNYMVGCAKRGQWTLIKYVFLIPIYWLMMSVSAAVAFVQLLVAPHYWEKTNHGLHLPTGLPSMLPLEPPKPAQQAAKSSPAFLRKFRNFFFDGALFSGGLLVGASLLGNVLNFLYNSILTRSVSWQEFGVLSTIGSMVYVAQVPLGALCRTISHRSAYILGKYNQPATEFWAHTRRVVLLVAVIATAAWIILVPALAQFFHLTNVFPLLVFAPVWFISLVYAVDSGFLSGNWQFRTLGLLVVLEALAKVVLTAGFIRLGRADLIAAAIPLSMLISFGIAWMQARRLTQAKALPDQAEKAADKPSEAVVSLKQDQFPLGYFAESIVLRLNTLSSQGLDVVLAAHFLNEAAVGQYAFLSLIGKMVFFFGTLLSQFIVPVASRDIGAGQDGHRFFNKVFLASIGLNLLACVGLGVLGTITIPLLWGAKAVDTLPYALTYVAASACFGLATLITNYRQTRKESFFTWLSFSGGVLFVVLMLVRNATVSDFVTDYFWAGVINLGLILIAHIFYGWFQRGFDAIRNFGELFYKVQAPLSTGKLEGGKLRILVFNWRDTRHTWAGGAEVYVHELAKRWVDKGHEVTLFCGNDTKHPRYEKVDGVRVIRRGGFYMVYVWAALYYLRFFRGKFDVILDCENGIPFFTPLYAAEKKFLLIFHIHRVVFEKSLIWPLAKFASFLEETCMPAAYHQSPVVTISESSKREIITKGITVMEPAIVHSGIDLKLYKPGKKSTTPLVAYIGRLKDYKHIPVFIRMAEKIIQAQKEKQTVKFVIAGDGPERDKLEALVAQLGLAEKIEFVGRLSDAEKIALNQKAWVVVNPSMMEGWGITTIEANACGTPVIASDVPGLKESVNDTQTGFLVPFEDVEKFTEKVQLLLTDKKLRLAMGKKALTWAAQFDWDVSADKWLELFRQSLPSQTAPSNHAETTGVAVSTTDQEKNHAD